MWRLLPRPYFMRQHRLNPKSPLLGAFLWRINPVLISNSFVAWKALVRPSWVGITLEWWKSEPWWSRRYLAYRFHRLTCYLIPLSPVFDDGLDKLALLCRPFIEFPRIVWDCDWYCYFACVVTKPCQCWRCGLWLDDGLGSTKRFCC